MASPYKVLHVRFEDADDVIRQRYLEAVKQHPPDRCPQEFQQICEAYERIKTEEHRLAFLLFEPTQGETIDDLLLEEKCQTSLKRVGLSSLLSLLNER